MKSLSRLLCILLEECPREESNRDERGACSALPGASAGARLQGWAPSSPSEASVVGSCLRLSVLPGQRAPYPPKPADTAPL